MGILDIFKRSPRTFNVVIDEPWTINGEATQHDNPEDVLAEIYDIADHFPISITVQGPEQVFQIEMDDYGNTYPHGSVSKTAHQEDHHNPPNEKSQATDVATHTDIAAETPETDDTLAPSSFTGRFRQLIQSRSKAVMAGSALTAAALALIIAWPIIFGGNVSDEAQTISAGTGESWQTPIPETTTANQALDAQYTKKLWDLEPTDADSAAWFKAGVVTTNEAEVRLLDHHTGEQISSHTIADTLNLTEDLQWVAEFYHEDQPAVGLRIADTFTAMTADGQVQEWQIPSDAEISVYGTTPVVHKTTQAETTYHALVVGEKQPLQLTVNPAMTTRAVDNDWIIQLEIGAPRVVLNPVNRTNDEHEPHAVSLTAPTGDARFVRHLDAGHGYAMTLWDVQDELYLGIHAITGEKRGQVTSFLPAPFTDGDATGWALGNGMEVFVVGPYAISTSTGELEVFSGGEDITRAYGSAAVSEPQDQRLFTVDNTKYTESERIIGYSDQGIILVRLLDGSVAAYGDYGGIA